MKRNERKNAFEGLLQYRNEPTSPKGRWAGSLEWRRSRKSIPCSVQFKPETRRWSLLIDRPNFRLPQEGRLRPDLCFYNVAFSLTPTIAPLSAHLWTAIKCDPPCFSFSPSHSHTQASCSSRDKKLASGWLLSR